MYCKNCGREIPDSAKFCGFCGERQDDVMPEERESGSVVSFDSDGGVAAEEITDEEERKVIRRSSRNPMIMKIVGIAVVAVLVIGIGFFAVSKLGLFSGASGSATDYTVWVTDDEFAFVKKLKEDEEKISIDSLRSDSSVYYSQGMAAMTPDGKTLYFINRFDSYCNTGTLYRAELDKLKKDSNKNESYITKIDSDVQVYSLMVQKDGTLLYQTDSSDNSKLNYFDGKETVTMAKNVIDVRQCGDSYIVYTTNKDGEDGYSIYIMPVGDTENAYKVASNAYLHTVKDETHILYYKYSDGSTAYYIGGFNQEPVKVAGNVEYMNTSQFQAHGTLFYSVENSGKLKLSDFVDNPYASSDAAAKEPKEADYEREVTKTDWWGDEYTTTETDWDAYNQAYDKWYAVQERISLMEYLEDDENGFETYSVYFYKIGDQEAVKVSDKSMGSDILGYSSGKNNMVMYAPAYSSTERLSIDQLMEDGYWYSGGVVSTIRAELVKDMDYVAYTVIGYSEQVLDLEAIDLYDETRYMDFRFYNDGTSFAMLLGDESDQEIYTATVTNGCIGKVSGISAQEPTSIGIINDAIYYSSNSGNDLDLYQYKNGEHERICEEVALYSSEFYEDGTMMMLCDYDYEYGGTLYAVDKSGKKTKINDDVTNYASLNNGDVLFISDGTLKLYDGKNKITIAQDVEMIWMANEKKGEYLGTKFASSYEYY